MFGVMPSAAWMPSSSSFAWPVAVVGSMGVKRGISVPFGREGRRRAAHQLVAEPLSIRRLSRLWVRAERPDRTRLAVLVAAVLRLEPVRRRVRYEPAVSCQPD